jgi:hypothetical protein
MPEMKYLRPDPDLKIISPVEAGDAANKIIDETGMREWPQSSLLNNPKVEMQRPFTFQEDADEGEASTQSYIVPFGIKDEHDKDGTPLTRLCILLDAVTREFEEVTAFGTPVAYLSGDKAIAVVAAALHIPPAQLIVTEVTQMFEPGEISNVRAYPFWKIVVDDRAYYVDQAGKLYSELSAGKAGS